MKSPPRFRCGAPSFLWVLMLLGGLCLSAGCPAMRWYAHQTSRGAVQGFFDGMTDLKPPLRHQVMAGVLEDPALRQTAHDVTASIVLGAVDGFAQAKLDKLASEMVQNAMNTLRLKGDSAVSQLVRESGPLLEQALRRAVEDSVATMGSAMYKSAQSDMGAATTLLMRAAVDGMLQSLNRTGRELARDLDQNTERFLREKVAPGMGQISHTLVREAVLGLQEGITQSGMKEDMPALRMVMKEVGMGLGEGLGVGLGRSVQKSPLEPILTGITIVLGILFVTALVGIVLIWRKYATTSNSLALFAQELNEAEVADQARGQALRRAILEAHTSANSVAFLNKFLKRRGLYKELRNQGETLHSSSTPSKHSVAGVDNEVYDKFGHENGSGPDKIPQPKNGLTGAPRPK